MNYVYIFSIVHLTLFSHLEVFDFYIAEFNQFSGFQNLSYVFFIVSVFVLWLMYFVFLNSILDLQKNLANNTKNSITHPPYI